MVERGTDIPSPVFLCKWYILKVMRDGPLKDRQERQIDEVLRVTKDTNRMLHGERNARRIKMIITLLVILGICGYGYYLFEKHKIRIIEFQQQVEELRDHLQEAAALADKVGDTAKSIRGIFSGLEPSQGQVTQE